MSVRNIWKSVNQYSYSSGPSYLQQLRCVMWRSWITNIREPMLVKIKFIQTVVRLEIVWEIIIQSIIKFTWPWQKGFIYLMCKQMNFLILLLMVNHIYFLVRVFSNSYYYLWMFIRMLFYFQPFFLQIFALFMGLVYLKTDNNYIQEDIMNINGVIFLLIISYTYNNLFPVLNVSIFFNKSGYELMVLYWYVFPI